MYISGDTNTHTHALPNNQPHRLFDGKGHTSRCGAILIIYADELPFLPVTAAQHINITYVPSPPYKRFDIRRNVKCGAAIHEAGDEI